MACVLPRPTARPLRRGASAQVRDARNPYPMMPSTASEHTPMTADRLDELPPSEGSSGKSPPRPSVPQACELARVPDAARGLQSLEMGQLVASRYRIERPLRRYGVG